MAVTAVGVGQSLFFRRRTGHFSQSYPELGCRKAGQNPTTTARWLAVICEELNFSLLGRFFLSRPGVCRPGVLVFGSRI